MVEQLQQWFKSFDYHVGVNLYLQLGDNDYLKKLLIKREDDFNKNELKSQLKSIYEKLKTAKPTAKVSSLVQAVKAPVKEVTSILPPTNEVNHQTLYESCKAEADKLYKQLMNQRAILFSKCTIEKKPSENSPAAVSERQPLAMAICELQLKVDEAYSLAEYVALYGKLPDVKEVEEEEIPPHDLKIARSNLKKSIARLKRMEQTPERIQLLITNQERLKKIEDGISKL